MKLIESLYFVFFLPLSTYNNSKLKGIFFMTLYITIFSQINLCLFNIFHTCIKKVSEELTRFTFNTAVSAFMICINELTNLKCNKRKIITPFIIILSPYAPYIAEEIWQKLGNNNSIHGANWPNFEKKYLEEKNYTYPVSFNGKMRFKLVLALDLSNDEIKLTS